jgi:nicotinamidase-related amidase
MVPLSVNDKDLSLFNSKKTAVLVIDMHKGSLGDDATFTVARGRHIISKLRGFLGECRELGLYIVYVVTTHRIRGIDTKSPYWNSAKYSSMFPGIEKRNIEGSESAEVVDELKPRENDLIVSSKRRLASFHSTDLELLLRNIGADTVAITGIMAEACCMCAAFEAFNRDFRVVFIRDCTAGENREIENTIFNVVDRHLGWVMKSEDFINLMKKNL